MRKKTTNEKGKKRKKRKREKREEMEVKVKFVTFDCTSGSSWETQVKKRDEITFEWLKSLPTQSDGDDGTSEGNDKSNSSSPPAEFEISLLDKSGDWIKLATESDLTLKLTEFPENGTVKFMVKKLFSNFKWGTIESTLGALSEDSEARSAVVSVAKTMLSDPAAVACLNAMAQEIFTDSALLSEALREAVHSLSGLPEDGLQPIEQPKETKKKSDSDKTLKEILMEMDGFKEAPPPPQKNDQPAEPVPSSSPSALQTAPQQSSSSTSSLSSSSSNPQKPSKESKHSKTSKISKFSKGHKVPNHSPPSKAAAAAAAEAREKEAKDSENGDDRNDGNEHHELDDKDSSSESASSDSGKNSPEEKGLSARFFGLFRKNNKDDLMKCKEELEKNSIECSEDEIRAALSRCKTPEKAVCFLSQKYGNN